MIIRNEHKTSLVWFFLAMLLFVFCLKAEIVKDNREINIVTLNLPDTTILNELKDEKFKNFYLRYLCSNRDWQVGKSVMAVVAEPRSGDGAFHIKSDRCKEQISVWITFGKYSRATSTMKERTELTSHIKPGTSSVQIKQIYKKDDLSPLKFTYHVRIFEPEFAIEIDEMRAEAGIELMPKVLQAIVDDVKKVHRVYKANEPVIWKDFLPPGSVQDRSSLKIEEGSQKGIYIVKGYLNMQEPGYIAMRIFGETSGKEISKSTNEYRTIEFIGWSSNSSENFFFEREIVLDHHGKEPVRFEVWFHPVTERKVLEGRIQNAEGWVR